MTKKSSPQEMPFEEALDALEKLVETLEAGDLSLEESLQAFEQGVALTRNCQKALQQAEQKVEILSRASTEAGLEPFESDD